MKPDPSSNEIRAGDASSVDPDQVERLQAAIGSVIRAFLVAGRSGAPAEGRLRYNPLYFHILNLLAADGPTRPSALAEQLAVARTTLSAAADALSGQGLIERGKDPDDGRAVRLRLTEAGRQAAAAIQRQDRRNSAALLSSLTQKERDLLLPLIERAAESVSRR